MDHYTRRDAQQCVFVLCVIRTAVRLYGKIRVNKKHINKENLKPETNPKKKSQKKVFFLGLFFDSKYFVPIPFEDDIQKGDVLL